MSLDIAKIVKEIVKIEIDYIGGFAQAYRNQYNSGVADLRARIAESPDEEDFHADEKMLLDEIAKLSEELAIVALYRVVELNTLKILKWHWTQDDIDTKRLYQFDKLKKACKRELKLNLSKIIGYTVVDELRLVNNAIKHKRVVTDELAKYPGWIAGGPLEGLGDMFKRASQVVPDYMYALAGAVIPR